MTHFNNFISIAKPTSSSLSFPQMLPSTTICFLPTSSSLRVPFLNPRSRTCCVGWRRYYCSGSILSVSLTCCSALYLRKSESEIFRWVTLTYVGSDGSVLTCGRWMNAADAKLRMISPCTHPANKSRFSSILKWQHRINEVNKGGLVYVDTSSGMLLPFHFVEIQDRQLQTVDNVCTIVTHVFKSKTTNGIDVC